MSSMPSVTYAWQNVDHGTLSNSHAFSSSLSLPSTRCNAAPSGAFRLPLSSSLHLRLNVLRRNAARERSDILRSHSSRHIGGLQVGVMSTRTRWNQFTKRTIGCCCGCKPAAATKGIAHLSTGHSCCSAAESNDCASLEHLLP